MSLFSLDKIHLYWQMGCGLIHPARVPGSILLVSPMLSCFDDFNVQCTRIWHHCPA